MKRSEHWLKAKHDLRKARYRLRAASARVARVSRAMHLADSDGTPESLAIRMRTLYDDWLQHQAIVQAQYEQAKTRYDELEAIRREQAYMRKFPQRCGSPMQRWAITQLLFQTQMTLLYAPHRLRVISLNAMGVDSESGDRREALGRYENLSVLSYLGRTDYVTRRQVTDYYAGCQDEHIRLRTACYSSGHSFLNT